MIINIILLFPSGPSEVRLSVDGSTDQCSRGEDIVFHFIGFLISGQVREGRERRGREGGREGGL